MTTRTRNRAAKRGLAAIAIAIGLLTLAPISSSFVVLSSSSTSHSAGGGGTSVIAKSASMPAWVAEIVRRQNAHLDSAENEPVIDAHPI
jgi:hypothetical protein